MKHIYKYLLYSASVMTITSCVDYNKLDFQVEKPLAVELQEEIDAYEDLKNYSKEVANLGSGVGLTDYTSRGTLYRLVNRNFDEITLRSGMNHGAIVQADGSLILGNLEGLLEEAVGAGMKVFGQPLVWHLNQNSTYLKSTIAPTEFPGEGGPTWDIVTSADFETDEAPNYQFNEGAVPSFTVDGEGADGVGRALMITNEVVRQDEWDSQFFITFSPQTEAGEEYELSMKVRSDVAASFPTQAHRVPYDYKHWDFFGTIHATPEWATYTQKVVISELTEGCTTIAFNLGNTATNYYFDDIQLRKYNEKGGSLFVEKTPEEKKEIVVSEMERWIEGLMVVSTDFVKAWDVLKDPMDDANPTELRTGGESLPSGQFYWQDYVGKDYGVIAFNAARANGNGNDLLFISDHNLESNLDKCNGLIGYMEYIEAQGAQVDGISTQMNMDVNADKEKIVEMFKLLANTGKFVKISELNIGLGVAYELSSQENLVAQREMYKFVVEKYLEHVPTGQQYGITVWSPVDDLTGLWTEGNMSRRPAYAGVADGLGRK